MKFSSKPHTAFLILSVIVGSLMSASSCHAYSLDFTMENDTNRPIVEFMASRTTDSRYIPFHDVYVRSGGGQQKFTFQGGATGDDCYIDIKLKFQNGQYVTIDHINLCSVALLTIDVENNKVVYRTK